MVITNTAPGYKREFEDLDVGTLFSFIYDPQRFCIKIPPVKKIKAGKMLNPITHMISPIIYNAIDIKTGELYSIRNGRLVNIAEYMP